jgi:HD-GYP domain-containing protein (c-di-GMP phosphodiesterase class II)
LRVLHFASIYKSKQNRQGKGPMIKRIKSSELKVGMFIELPHAWRAHPFLKNSFTITSEKQIKKIIEHGITEVNIDEAKGLSITPTLPEDKLPVKTLPVQVVPEALKAAIYDKEMLPETKAQAVHMHSVNMMNNLWMNPTGENIAEFKKGIVAVVDLILADDATTKHLLRLTSYDYNTYIHSVNVGVLAISLAKVLFVHEDKHNMHALGAGFFLHDIGKIHIDEAIINKPGKLTEEEMTIMRKHPGMGFKHLVETKQINDECRLIVLQHHERHDGMGYPKRIRGEGIHVYGRICSVADVFDALVSKRPYKKQLQPFEALKVMKDEMLDHFHKEIFEKFVLLFQ